MVYTKHFNILLQLIEAKNAERRVHMGKNMTPWGKQCKVQMALLGLSLKDLSEAVGLSNTYVSAIINGRVVAPEETVDKISRALQVKMSSVN